MEFTDVPIRAAFAVDAGGIVRNAKVNDSPRDRIDFASIEEVVRP